LLLLPGSAPAESAGPFQSWSIPIRAPYAATGWILAYLALIVAPLGLLLLGETPPGGGFWWDFALALGYSSLAMMGVQFWLTARFKRATAPFGIDIIYYFHRYLAAAAFVLLLGHVAVLFTAYRPAVGPLQPWLAPGYMTLGWLALLAFALLIGSSLLRKQVGLDYEPWRRAHIVLAVLGIVFAVLHVLGSGSYVEAGWKRALWALLALSWIGLAVWVRLLRPARLKRAPYQVLAVQHEPGRNWTLRLAPRDGATFAYRPGQFAWLTLRASPFALCEHPFSFASSPTRPGTLEFMIKELGDFTSTIGDIRPGETAWVDGPYGSFGVDFHPHATGYVFVAGGAGIAPIISMLRALADRGDIRPLWLFYGNRRRDRIVFGDELDALASRLDLRLIHVLSEPPDDWTGERGFVTCEVMARHLPALPERRRLHCFVCGPTPMIRLAERNLEQLSIPLRHLHSEIFDLA
jgi:predicted ferric reductase